MFDFPKHKLSRLLEIFGGNQTKAFRALDKAAQKAFKEGKLNLSSEGINKIIRVKLIKKLITDN